MERRFGQRILSAVAGIGVALLFGSGMALGASGVFKVPDYATTTTPSAAQAAGAGHGVSPTGRHGEDSASPILPDDVPAIPVPPEHSLLVPGDRAEVPGADLGGEEDGVHVGEAESPRGGRSDDQCNNGNRGHEKSGSDHHETGNHHRHCA